MSKDTRIINTLPNHPKTRKLIKKVGQQGAWNLICLFIFTTENRSDGELTGLGVDDIEMVSDWLGAEGEFVKALREVGFLEMQGGVFVIHDWATHNPWASSQGLRNSKARWNAVYRHHGKAEADRQVPEYAQIRKQVANEQDATSTPSRNAPSPSPLPSPKPKKEKPDALVYFPEFWSAYPRRDDRVRAEKAWVAHGCDAIASEVVKGAVRYAQEKTGSEKKHIALPTTWLNGKRWMDEGNSTDDEFGGAV